MSSTKPAIHTIPFGATWTQFNIPNGNKTQNIILTFPTDDLFATHSHPYLGATIGRVANRIANGKISDLNGQNYQLTINDGENSLHGGQKGWDKHSWTAEQTSKGTWDAGIKNLSGDDTKTGTVYTLTSSDGDQGYPGAVKAWAWYFEGRGPKGEVVLDIEYEAKLIDDKVESTVIGLTNHAYFNLNGANEGAKTREEEWNLDSHTASLASSSYQVLGENTPGIPTGEIKNHPEVPAEANTSFSLTGSDEKTRPIDDCFILPTYVSSQSDIQTDSRSLPLQTLGTIKGDKTGIVLKVESTEPAFQFYTGKFTDVGAFEGGKGYGAFSAFCLEPSRFVDAAGRKEWREQVSLKKGETWGARSRYWGWKE